MDAFFVVVVAVAVLLVGVVAVIALMRLRGAVLPAQTGDQPVARESGAR